MCSCVLCRHCLRESGSSSPPARLWRGVSMSRLWRLKGERPLRRALGGISSRLGRPRWLDLPLTLTDGGSLRPSKSAAPSISPPSVRLGGSAASPYPSLSQALRPHQRGRHPRASWIVQKDVLDRLIAMLGAVRDRVGPVSPLTCPLAELPSRPLRSTSWTGR